MASNPFGPDARRPFEQAVCVSYLMAKSWEPSSFMLQIAPRLRFLTSSVSKEREPKQNV